MVDDLGPVTRALAGLLRGSGLDESDYHKYLEEKHLGVRYEESST